MCIVALAWQILDDLPICLISNRDEFHRRPSTQLHQWVDSSIIAGQDLQAGGTWMGVSPQGRWAIVTNYRDGSDQELYSSTRGDLVQAFLASEQTPIRFAKTLEQRQRDYAGFNLFVGDQQQAVYMSNRGEAPQLLSAGVYVVSNGLMSEAWEKCKYLRKRFTQELLPLFQMKPTPESAIQHVVWDILQDERKVNFDILPQTGLQPDLEHLLSSTFIQSEHYGTRCSNFLRIGTRQLNWIEKTQYGLRRGNTVEMNVDLL